MQDIDQFGSKKIETTSPKKSRSDSFSSAQLAEDLSTQNSITEQAQTYNYKLIKVIGKGTYSTVYLSSSTHKRVKKQNSNLDDQFASLDVCKEESKDNNDESIVSQISEGLQEPTSLKDILDVNQQIASSEQKENITFQALKIIQRPNYQDKTYIDQKLIFMNDAQVLQSIQGHPNIVNLIQVIPQGVVQVQENGSSSKKLHVDYAMAIECIKGGELYYNMQKFGKYEPEIAHFFFVEVVGAIQHMHERGFCHRDLKPWNIMLSDDLSSAKVIDFSYSTPLDQEEFQKCPNILKGWLSGTKQFMAPEQMDQSKFPIMEDFSKIDVFALGVLIINMITLNFSFENVVTDHEKYQEFIGNPMKYFTNLDVKFSSEQEVTDLCDLIQQLLEFDLNKRIAVSDILKSAYIQNHHQDISSDHVRKYMQQRLLQDQTISHIDQSFQESMTDLGVPNFIPFSWNCTIIRHTFQKGYKLDQIINQYSQALDDLFDKLLVDKSVQKQQYFTIVNQGKDNVFLLTLEKPNSEMDKKVLYLKQNMQAVLVFSIHQGVFACEILRRQGDYLSFIKFYCLMWQHFNKSDNLANSII